MAASWQRLGDAVGCVGIGVNRVRIDPGRLVDSAPLARRLRGDRLRPRRVRLLLAGRAGLRASSRRLCRPSRRSRGAHAPRRARRARSAHLRDAASDRARLAAAVGGDSTGLPVGRGPHRRPVGRRGAGRAARVRRAGAAAEEHRQRRRGRGRGMGEGRLRLRRDGARASRRRRQDRDAARGHPRREAQLPAALPRPGGGVLRRARRRGHVPARGRGASPAARLDRRPAAQHRCGARLPRPA